MFNDHYQEKLPCGATLKVNKSRWEIEYYYPGIDRRHNGEFFTIYEAEIDGISQALINNFMNYLNLKDTIPKGGEYNTTGEMDMVIATGVYFQGVSLHRHSDFISTQEQLAARLTSFETAKKRAVVIQQALANI